MFVFNSAFLALVDEANDHPFYRWLGWFKDPAFYALLMALALGEFITGWFLAESGIFVGVPWQYETYIVLSIAMLVSVSLFFAGYGAWKKEQEQQKQQEQQKPQWVAKTAYCPELNKYIVIRTKDNE